MVGARCFIDLEMISGENERKLEIIGGLRFGESFIGCGSDFTC
jgi:hypothetical protein